MYKSLLENCSSRANARIFSPASIRLTIPSLNARLKTRCDDFGLDIRSPMENCPLFSVSHFWGALQRRTGNFLRRRGKSPSHATRAYIAPGFAPDATVVLDAVAPAPFLSVSLSGFSS